MPDIETQIAVTLLYRFGPSEEIVPAVQDILKVLEPLEQKLANLKFAVLNAQDTIKQVDRHVRAMTDELWETNVD